LDFAPNYANWESGWRKGKTSLLETVLYIKKLKDRKENNVLCITVLLFLKNLKIHRKQHIVYV
jgi:hypothetical protein